MTTWRNAVILKTTSLGLVAEYVRITSSFKSLDNLSLFSLGLSWEASGAVVDLDFGRIIPCNDEYIKGCRCQRQRDQTRDKIQQLGVQVTKVDCSGFGRLLILPKDAIWTVHKHQA